MQLNYKDLTCFSEQTIYTSGCSTVELLFDERLYSVLTLQGVVDESPVRPWELEPGHSGCHRSRAPLAHLTATLSYLRLLLHLFYGQSMSFHFK